VASKLPVVGECSVASITPAISTAVAGVTQAPAQQSAVRENPAAIQVAAQQAGTASAVDASSRGPEVKAKSRAPTTQKRVESPFANQNPKQTAKTQAAPEDQDPPSSRAHDGKLSVVA